MIERTTATRVVASALLAATMVGLPIMAYPFVYGWYALGVGAVVAVGFALLGFRRLSHGTYSRVGATVAGIVGMVTVINWIASTDVGRPGAYRTAWVQFGLLAATWVCGSIAAFIGSFVRIARRKAKDRLSGASDA